MLDGSLVLGGSLGWPGWRNRHTRAPQKRLSSRTCGFESRSRHHADVDREAAVRELDTSDIVTNENVAMVEFADVGNGGGSSL